MSVHLKSKIVPSPNDWERLRCLVQRYRSRNMEKDVVMTSGAFDVFHIGHLRYLEASRKFGDYLVVLINSDMHVRKNKGNSRPIYSQEDRAYIIASFACVSLVMIADDLRETPLHYVQPDIRVYSESTGLNDDVFRKDCDIIEGYGGEWVVLPEQSILHSSDMIKHMKRVA